jgi:hypothetical protein
MDRLRNCNLDRLANQSRKDSPETRTSTAGDFEVEDDIGLPSEWNWCKVWCDERKEEQAKTIGVCEDPVTGERDLEWMAQHLPEWTNLSFEADSVE